MRAGIGQLAPLHHVTTASDPLYYTWSGSYLRLNTYPYQEVPCLCFSLCLAYWQPVLLSISCPHTFSLPQHINPTVPLAEEFERFRQPLPPELDYDGIT